MADYEVIVKRLEPMRVPALSENLAGVEEIGEACGRMYPRLHAALAQHQVGLDGLSLALYEDTADEDLPLHHRAADPRRRSHRKRRPYHDRLAARGARGDHSRAWRAGRSRCRQCGRAGLPASCSHRQKSRPTDRVASSQATPAAHKNRNQRNRSMPYERTVSSARPAACR
jgi:hypothetical protein